MTGDIGVTIKGNSSQLKSELASAGAAAQEFGNRAETSLNKVGLSAKQLAFAARGVPAQFTDIFASLQAGQSPITVFLQQGGQLKDMFGGVGPAAKAMGGYIMGLVNPYTLAAGAAGALGYAWYKGSEEAHEYTKAIILSGNAAGVTAAQLQEKAVNISKTSSATQGAAAEALALFTRNGNIAEGKMGSYASAAIQMQKLTGVAVADTVKQFAELGKDPLAASIKLNESHHYLTLSVYDQIKALEEQGKKLEAGTLAQQSWADAVNSRMPQLQENLGLVEAGWKGISGAAKTAWDNMLNIGRQADPVTEMRNQLADLLAKRASGVELYNGQGASQDVAIAMLREGLAIANRIASAQQMGANAAAATNKQLENQLVFDKAHEQYQTKAVQLQKELTAENQRYANVKNTGDDQKDLQNARDHATALLAIRKKFEDFGPAKESLTGTISYYEQLQSIVTTGEKTAQESITSQHKRNLISSRDYYTAAEEIAANANTDQQALVELEIEAVKKSGIAATEKAGQLAKYNEELTRLKEQETGIHQKAADQIAAIGEKSSLAAAEAHVKYIQGIITDTDKIQKEIDQLKQQTAEYGLAKEAIQELRAAELERQADTLMGMALYDSLDSAPLKQVQALRDKAAAIHNLGTRQTIVDAETEAAKAAAEERKHGWEETDRIARDIFVTWGNDGKNVAQKITDTFKAGLLSAIYEAQIRPFVFGLYNAATGSSGAGNALGAASGLNTLAGIGSAYSIGSGFSKFAATGVGKDMGLWSAGNNPSAAGLTETGAAWSQGLTTAASVLGYADAFSAAAGGKWGTAAGEAIGTYLLPGVGTLIGKAIGAALDNAFAGEMRAGGQYTYSTASGTAFAQGPSGGQIMGADVQRAINDTVGTINNLLKGVGSAARLSGFQAGLESSGDNRGGVYSGGTFTTGATFGESGKGSNYNGTLYESTSTQSPDAQTAMANFATDLTQATLEALQAATDIPKTISDMLAGRDVEAMTSQAATELLNTIDAVVATVTDFNAIAKTLPFANLTSLSFDMAAGLIAAAGGMQTLGTNLATYYDKFYNEAEKRAQTISNINATVLGAGIAGFDASSASRDQYRALVEAQDATTASGQKAYAALISVAGAFDQINPLATAAAAGVAAVDKVLEGLTSTNASLTDQYNKLALSESDYRATQIKGMTDVQVAMYDSNVTMQKNIDMVLATKDTLAQAAQDLAAATDQAATSLASLQTRYADPLTLQTAAEQIAQTLGANVAEVLAMDSAGMRLFVRTLSKEIDPATESGKAFLATLGGLTPAFDTLVSGANTATTAVNAAAAAFDWVQYRADEAAAHAASVEKFTTQISSSYANVQSALAGVGNAVQSLADKAKASETTLQGSRDSISNALFAAQDRVTQLQQKSADSLRAFTGSIDDFLYTISPTTGSDASMASLKAQLSATGVLAAADPAAQGRLLAEARAVLKAAEASSTDRLQYARTESFVRATLESVKKTVNPTPIVDAVAAAIVSPMDKARAELEAAKDDVLAYTALAQATGASTTKVADTAGAAIAKLSGEYQIAMQSNTTAQGEYQAALDATKDLHFVTAGSLEALNKALAGYDSANAALAKSYSDAYAAHGMTLDVWVVKLGLAGTAASDFVTALNIAMAGITHVSTPPPPIVVPPVDTSLQGMVLKAYSAVGRNGIGEGGLRVDQAGLDYWVNTLSTGALALKDFQNTFLNAVVQYDGPNKDTYQGAVGLAQGYINSGTKLQGFASGTNYMLEDGPIYAHAGETITPAPYVDLERNVRNETNLLLQRLLDSNRELKTEVVLLKKANETAARNIYGVGETLTRVTRGGVALITTSQ